MMLIEFNFNNFARVCHSLAACQGHTPSSLAALIGLSNNDVVPCVPYTLRWLETPLYALRLYPVYTMKLARRASFIV